MPAARSTASRKAEAEIAVRAINGFIGAEIEGIDLRQPLSPSQFKVVHDALVQYEVIVLRDQDITIDQQMASTATARRGAAEREPPAETEAPHDRSR